VWYRGTNRDDLAKDKITTSRTVTTHGQFFKIMSGTVNGYETMARIGPCVSITDRHRTKPTTNKYYLLARNVPSKPVKPGYVWCVILVADQELWKLRKQRRHILVAWRNFGRFNIELPFEQHYNPLTRIKLEFRLLFCS
jgi:hypothetical protein